MARGYARVARVSAIGKLLVFFGTFHLFLFFGACNAHVACQTTLLTLNIFRTNEDHNSAAKLRCTVCNHREPRKFVQNIMRCTD